MTVQQSERLVSLDVFRGLTIAGMILVNNPGSWSNIYPALQHAKWNGCTPTDYIFPFFLFIVGVAITVSLTKRKESGLDQKKLIWQIFKRGLIIFAIGIFMAAWPFWNFTEDRFIDLSLLRIPGVLQRIGVVYFFTSLIFLKTNIKTQAVIGVLLLAAYWLIMTLIPVPGYGMPNLNVATLTDAATQEKFAPNLAGWLDKLILGNHMWKASKVWDPEGILSTIPAIATCLSGVMLGHWLRTKNDSSVKTSWIFVFGNFAILIGVIWDMWFPMNKSLWTSSYVMFTTGMALLFFGMCYWIIDVKGIKWWTKPFVVYGMNAITVFALSGLVAKTMGIIKVTNELGEKISLNKYLYKLIFVPNFSPINASLAWALVYVLIWLGLMWILYAKRIFIKV
jgi:predicted acyltransferase